MSTDTVIVTKHALKFGLMRVKVMADALDDEYSDVSGICVDIPTDGGVQILRSNEYATTLEGAIQSAELKRKSEIERLEEEIALWQSIDLSKMYAPDGSEMTTDSVGFLTIYVTKHILDRGIIATDGAGFGDDDSVNIKISHRIERIKKTDYALQFPAAQEQAEAMRKKAIALLEKEVVRLWSIDFSKLSYTSQQHNERAHSRKNQYTY